MSQPTSEPTGEPQFIRPLPESLMSQTDIRLIVQDFEALQPPPLEEPGSCDEAAAARKSAENTIQLSSKGKPDNIEKKNKVTRACGSLIHFVRRHPWLTAGMAIALIFLMLSFQTAVSALAQQTNVNIFNIHYVIGGGVAFTFLMYAIMLNNMRRRAIAEKKRDASYEAAAEALKKTSSRGKRERAAAVQAVNLQIQETHKARLQELDDLKNQKEELDKDLKQIKTTKNKLEVINDEFYVIFSALLDKLQEQKSVYALFKKEWSKVIKAISQGAEKMQCPEILDTPGIQLVEIVYLEAEIPSTPTPNMEKNTAKAKKVSEKINGFFTSIGPALKSNPESKVYYSIGFFILGLAGFGLYLWLQGYSQVYFFGLLNPTTLVPMTIAGLCLVYEGWNKSAIDAINKNREKIIEKQNQLDETQKEQRQLLEKIKSQSDIALGEFREKWEKYIREERHKITAAKKDSERALEDLRIVEAGADSAINVILAFFPDLKRSELSSQARAGFAALGNAVTQ